MDDVGSEAPVIGDDRLPALRVPPQLAWQAEQTHRIVERQIAVVTLLGHAGPLGLGRLVGRFAELHVGAVASQQAIDVFTRVGVMAD